MCLLQRRGSAQASHLEDLVWSLLLDLLLEDVLALDLVVLAESSAGQYQARQPVMSPVEGFFPLRGGLALVLAHLDYL